jgi:hypothetical protein
MPKMSLVNEQEFADLSAYVSLFSTLLRGIPESSDIHPSHHMDVIPGEVSKSQRLAGLRQATNDTIEATRDFTPAQVAAVDAAFRARKVITLSEVRRRYWSKYKAVIRRGCIRNETEYYLVAGLLNDTGAQMDAAERETLLGLVAIFESKVVQRAQSKRPKSRPSA